MSSTLMSSLFNSLNRFYFSIPTSLPKFGSGKVLDSDSRKGVL